MIQLSTLGNRLLALLGYIPFDLVYLLIMGQRLLYKVS
jgi:hypothetical protein